MSSLILSSSNSTSTDGCVVCPDKPECPSCNDDELCVLTPMTCYSCPTTYCAQNTNSTTLGNSTNNGSNSNNGSGHNGSVPAIVGGVVGGIVALFLIATYFLYKKYWKPKKDAERKEDSDKRLSKLLGSVYDGDLEDLEDDDDLFSDDDDLLSEDNDEVPDLPGTSTQGQYGSTPAKYSHSGFISKGSNMMQPGNRSSSSTLHTKASNILPIAYIPGVTTVDGRGRTVVTKAFKNHALNTTGDVRSHITLGSSIFDSIDGDYLNDDDIGSRRSVLESNSSSNSSSNGSKKGNKSSEQLTTAIRARPRLVNIKENGEEGGEAIRSSSETGGLGLGDDFMEGKSSQSMGEGSDYNGELDLTDEFDRAEDDDSFVLDVKI
ncbi:hypothetical protein Kpol_190p1 [Vanderwaltozyma polyspora DSM 70294]|uniref:Membrane anchor Opy2 N-terminal domain-containing protein n=1 Tax=Vanderwaltozyma polyspora (strain ATCC 22028 / DSM 70294 / BCRC 21397 / CBS 2163 / NBRC 10782 / NRRL Y-8283 / UCD 57-17) TaxID=436907 RepID=A7TTR0_VANPO|nr:uncharacterized protein Kpol_190p1 [Vanderwaltozyma polyspora DSM 70294]EDO14347.1 hypothetical protein Kpol_190p1 [Vanderwaltozyma polyspora DSM 70294]